MFFVFRRALVLWGNSALQLLNCVILHHSSIRGLEVFGVGKKLEISRVSLESLRNV